MNIKKYRVSALGDTRDVLKKDGRETYWDISATTMQSAWGKFITQRFAALKPNPDHYDISLVQS